MNRDAITPLQKFGVELCATRWPHCSSYSRLGLGTCGKRPSPPASTAIPDKLKLSLASPVMTALNSLTVELSPMFQNSMAYYPTIILNSRNISSSQQSIPSKQKQRSQKPQENGVMQVQHVSNTSTEKGLCSHLQLSVIVHSDRREKEEL